MTAFGLLDDLEPRLGLGTLRLSTDGRPEDVEARAVLHAAMEQGVRLVDTADTYCRDDDERHYGERLVRDALRTWNGPSEDVCVVTKVGLARPGGRWVPNGRPGAIRESVEGSLEALGVDRLPLLLLHARDPGVPFEETLAALAELQTDGLAEHVGLCNVSVAEIRQAQRHFAVAAVQNELNVLERAAATDGVVEFTRREGIAFLASRPLGGKKKLRQLAAEPVLAALAERHGVTPVEVALVVVKDVGEHVVPLVGATRIGSVRSSVRAAAIEFDVSDRMAVGTWFSFEPTAAARAALEPSAVPTGLAELPENVGPGDSPEVVLVMGVQGAGKSELVADYVAAGYARLNRDEIGGTLDGLVPRLEQLLAAGHDRVVLDNTYPSRLSRAPVVAAAHRHGVPVRCRFLDTPLAEARINVVLRMVGKYGLPLGPDEMKMFRKMDSTLPPPIALEKWFAAFEPPAADEGFSAVDVIPFVRRVDPTHVNTGLLLDVDGTLRTTRSGAVVPKDVDDVVLLPNRRERLAEWVDDGYELFFVSNQGGIALGYSTHEETQAALFRTRDLLGLPVKEIVYCPHPPKPVGCFCRKPMPGLGVYLMQRHALDPKSLVMVGDRDADVGFAAAIGATYYDEGEFFGG